MVLDSENALLSCFIIKHGTGLSVLLSLELETEADSLKLPLTSQSVTGSDSGRSLTAATLRAAKHLNSDLSTFLDLNSRD